MGIPHVIAIPYPAQGHVTPLMMLAQKIARRGIKVTFVNTDFNHNRMAKALISNNVNNDIDDDEKNQINMVAIPDGLEPWESRTDVAKFGRAMEQVMPGKLEELIQKIDEADDDDKVSCIIVDAAMSWALPVAEKMGLKRAVFCPSAAAIMTQVFSIPKLLEEGIINNKGTVITKQAIYESLPIPANNIGLFTWNGIPHAPTSESVFKSLARDNELMKVADRIICNSSYDLETETFTFYPKMLPVGPLSADNMLENQSGNLWPDDSSCLQWLDQQPACSVIYIAFGSFGVFEAAKQFQEMALGLEQTNRPFLWVVRPGMADAANEAYLKGFKERVGSRGLIIDWAPQQQVLGHPSIACFLTHCGWNSTTEGVSNGLPFLCSPCFSDHFLIDSYICNVWKIGLRLEKDVVGCITKFEIMNKVEQLLGDQSFKARAMILKEKVVSGVQGDGHSYKNLRSLIDWMKEK